jgi:hypothetical protein
MTEVSTTEYTKYASVFVLSAMDPATMVAHAPEKAHWKNHFSHPSESAAGKYLCTWVLVQVSASAPALVACVFR